MPLVTSKTSTEVRNLSLNPEKTKMYSSFILKRLSKSIEVVVTEFCYFVSSLLFITFIFGVFLSISPSFKISSGA